MWTATTWAFHSAPAKGEEGNGSTASIILVLIGASSLWSHRYAGTSVFSVDDLTQEGLHDGEGDRDDALFSPCE